MSSQESKESQLTMKEHQENFKKLQKKVEDIREDIKRKLKREINNLEEKDRKDSEKLLARQKALALKGHVHKNIFTEDDRAEDEVPVDGEVKSGTMVFTKLCSVCHTLDAIDPKPHKGPSLGLIYNKRAGSNMNFDNYTDQLIKSTFFWSPLNLYRFMADPESLIPKTTCWLAKHPLTSEEDRADLITMFRQFTIETSFYIRWKQIQQVGYAQFQADLNIEKNQQKHGEQRDKRARDFDASV